MNSGGSCSSVYCLASCVETQASLVVSGSTDRVITVCDARSGETVVRLRGHTDAIRCLTLKHDGTLLLSGSSDGTVRMWDLRQQRCMRTYDAHSSDSVWALDAPRAFESFISGGRDGSVWHTSLDGDYASLVVDVADPVKWNNMVLDVALCRNDERRVWVSTTGSTVRQWLVPAVNSALNEGRRPAEQAVGSHGQTRPATESSPSNGVSNGTGEVTDHERPAQRRPGGSDAIDRHTFGGTRRPVVELQGLAGIIGYRIMNNRRYVMTCDTFEEVNVWDVTSASHVKSLGRLQEGTDLDAMLGKHDEQLSVPSWFKVDIRLGSLAIKLSKNSVGDAEVYAVDAGLEAETEEVKINIGDHVLRGLLSTWKTNLKRGADSGAHDGALENLRQAYESGDKNADSGREVAAAPAWAALKPYKFPPETLIVLSDDSPIPLLTKEAGEFEGEAETPVLPPWAVDVVREGNTMGREVAPKVGFTLYPVEGSGLPGLSTVNLTAPQVLRTRKVAQYVAKELAAVLELSANFKLEPHHIDILCHGKVVPPTMNLATTKKFMWQSEGTGDLVLAFRKAADTPATISAAIAAAAAAATARSQT
jgi:WD repeat-containing protein 48